MEHFIFTNARIVLPDTILDDHYLSVKNGVIESIGKGTPDREQLTHDLHSDSRFSVERNVRRCQYFGNQSFQSIGAYI